MSIDKTEVLALVAFLSATLADQTECSRIYDEVVQELGHDPRAWLAQVAVTDTGLASDTSDPEQYELRPAVVKLLGLFYAGRQLTEESIAALTASNTRWREEVGEPWAYTRQGESGRIVRLYPKPRVLPVTGENFTTYEQSVLTIYTELRVAVLPEVLVIPLALLILAREFERESVHRDQPLATVFRQLGMSVLNQVY